jgi:3-keto-disaccharide hydrolase
MLRAVVVVATISVLSAACTPGQGPAQGGGAAAPALPWTTLFDGTSLAAWTTSGDANWQLSDGVVAADMGAGFLVTHESFGDFELEVEFFVSLDANSGVFLRCANPEKPGAATCYEVNIFDQRKDPSYRTGAIVGIAKPMAKIDAGNRWNTYHIEAHGRHLVVKLNGQTTVDVEDDKLATGPIGLQYAAGQVKFRSVRIRRQ